MVRGWGNIPNSGNAAFSSASAAIHVIRALGVGAVVGAVAAQACVGGVGAEAEAHGVLSLVVHLATLLGPDKEVEVMSLVSAGDSLNDVPPALE